MGDSLLRAQLKAALNRERGLRIALEMARPAVDKTEDCGCDPRPLLKAIDKALLATGRERKPEGSHGRG